MRRRRPRHFIIIAEDGVHLRHQETAIRMSISVSGEVRSLLCEMQPLRSEIERDIVAWASERVRLISC